MSNKFAAFTVLSAVGIFNVIVYVLFVSPASLIPGLSYFPICSPGNESCAGSFPDKSENQQASTKSTSHTQPDLLATPTGIQFLERTLMQSGAKAAKESTVDISLNKFNHSNVTSGFIANTNGSVTAPCLLGYCAPTLQKQLNNMSHENLIATEVRENLINSAMPISTKTNHVNAKDIHELRNRVSHVDTNTKEKPINAIYQLKPSPNSTFDGKNSLLSSNESNAVAQTTPLLAPPVSTDNFNQQFQSNESQSNLVNSKQSALRRVIDKINKILIATPLTVPPLNHIIVNASGTQPQGSTSSNTSTSTTNATTSPSPAATNMPPPTPRVDPHNYTYIINQNDLCLPSSQEQLLVVFVCTAFGNFENRNAIRQTWGSLARNRTGVKLAFLLGTTPNATDQLKLVQEAANYSDIIQEDFVDTYNNLTLKSVMMLKWVNSFCRHTRFVLKTDDDMFINLKNLLRYLSAVRKRKRMLFGRLVRGARPVRDKTSKWYAPISTYRERFYPDYLSGTAYIMSGDVAQSVYSIAISVPLFHLEDVFITGICARKAGITRRHHNSFVYERRPPTGCAFKNAISGHKVTATEMHKIWDELHAKNLTCRR